MNRRRYARIVFHQRRRFDDRKRNRTRWRIWNFVKPQGTELVLEAFPFVYRIIDNPQKL